MKIWEPKPSGTLWATPGLLRGCFTFTFYVIYFNLLILIVYLLIILATAYFYASMDRNHILWKK